MPSHGTVAAYLALFVALGGTAYALDRGSVTSREIATGAVKRSEIATGAARRSEIASGAVGKAEIRVDAVAPSEIRENAVRSEEIRAGAVGTEELLDGAVTAPKLGADAVTGANVANGSLALADVAREVVSVEFDPPLMNAGDCVSEDSLVVPNKMVDDQVLVLPGSDQAGWNDQLTLDGYSAAGAGAPNQIAVTLCRPFGAGSVDPSAQPLSVLLLG
ncbi:MAG: hypothetical protein ACRDJY_06155 [Thermoleophilaceae bacterium]